MYNDCYGTNKQKRKRNSIDEIVWKIQTFILNIWDKKKSFFPPMNKCCHTIIILFDSRIFGRGKEKKIEFKKSNNFLRP